ncbi:MAG: sigma-70 family RNA polymerase sigma factor [Patescibacteria group bacterium]
MDEPLLYASLVKKIAFSIMKRLPLHVQEHDKEDIFHAGMIGLLSALKRFDPTKDVPFEVYARYRITGEIMEYLRSLDHASRRVRAQGRNVRNVRRNLTAQLGRQANPEETAHALGIPLDLYYHVEQQYDHASLQSFDNFLYTEWESIQRDTENTYGPDPSFINESRNINEKIENALALLPENESIVIRLFRDQELTLLEIGNVLNLSEGRVCQLYNIAVVRIRDFLEHNPREHKK